MVKLPFGEMPAGVALNIAVMDVMTHALDVAKATGQTVDDDELLETALTIGRQLITDDFRQPGCLRCRTAALRLTPPPLTSSSPSVDEGSSDRTSELQRLRSSSRCGTYLSVTRAALLVRRCLRAVGRDRRIADGP